MWGELAAPGQVHTVDGSLGFLRKCFPLGVKVSSQVSGSPSLRLTGMEGHHLHPRYPAVLDQVEIRTQPLGVPLNWFLTGKGAADSCSSSLEPTDQKLDSPVRGLGQEFSYLDL